MKDCNNRGENGCTNGVGWITNERWYCANHWSINLQPIDVPDATSSDVRLGDGCDGGEAELRPCPICGSTWTGSMSRAEWSSHIRAVATSVSVRECAERAADALRPHIDGYFQLNRDWRKIVADIIAAEFETSGDALDNQLGRWQDAIRDKVIQCSGASDSLIDGAGCDSGDPLDLSLAEIGQGFAHIDNQFYDLMNKFAPAYLGIDDKPATQCALELLRVLLTTTTNSDAYRRGLLKAAEIARKPDDNALRLINHLKSHGASFGVPMVETIRRVIGEEIASAILLEGSQNGDSDG